MEEGTVCNFVEMRQARPLRARHLPFPRVHANANMINELRHTNPRVENLYLSKGPLLKSFSPAAKACHSVIASCIPLTAWRRSLTGVRNTHVQQEHPAGRCIRFRL